MTIQFKIEAKIIRALDVIAGVEDERHYLNGIYVNVLNPATLQIVATDGVILAQHRHTMIHDDELPALTVGESCIVPRDTLKGLKIGKSLPFVDFTLGDGKWSVDYCGDTRSGKLIDGFYPDICRIWPRRYTERAGKYDSALLDQLSKAQKILECRFAARIFQNGESGALWVLRDDFAGVIMPMRDDRDTLPAWCGATIDTVVEQVERACIRTRPADASSAAVFDAHNDLMREAFRAVGVLDTQVQDCVDRVISAVKANVAIAKMQANSEATV